MNTLLKKDHLSDAVWRYRLRAPRIAKKHQAGQFIILRVDPEGERIPLTIANSNAKEGWIEIIFQTVGYTTSQLATLQEGDALADLVGPLGRPTHIEYFGHCLCIGGGVGIAPLYPIICALKKAGNKITSIIGSRNKDLLLLEEEIKKESDTLCIATDDGSKGHQGFVSDLFLNLVNKGEHFDFAIIIGPPMMMKVTSQLTLNAKIKTLVSLNPIMVDGTGMCGGCRVSIFNKTKFACVDGPEFDAAGVNWQELLDRLHTYKAEESHQCKLEDQL